MFVFLCYVNFFYKTRHCVVISLLDRSKVEVGRAYILRLIAKDMICSPPTVHTFYFE